MQDHSFVEIGSINKQLNVEHVMAKKNEFETFPNSPWLKTIYSPTTKIEAALYMDETATSIFMNYENGSESVLTLMGIHKEIEFYWKTDNVLVIRDDSKFAILHAKRQVEYNGKMVNIDILKIG